MIRRGTVAVCTLAVLLAPTGGTAYGAPAPDPSQTSAPPKDADSRDSDGSDTDLDPATAARLEKIRKQISALHDQAGSATDAYNAAAEKVKEQRKGIVDLAQEIERNEGRLVGLNKRAGAMARAQYRGVGLPVSQQLVVETDPERFLHSVSLFYKGQQATKGVIGQLDSTQESLRGSAKKASAQWEKLETSRKRREAAKKRVESKLEQAQKLESALADDELDLLKELEKDAAHARQVEWLRGGVLEEINGKASAKGKRALDFALKQIGRDYEWGATGPRTYDCSGLTLRAWEAAGVRIPRTSQMQWRDLKRVRLTDMRPGDLIIYKGDASHVGMYVGKGTMVHAPRTGRQIRVEGVGALPIRGIVRPDAR